VMTTKTDLHLNFNMYEKPFCDAWGLFYSFY
jgi:hypothetical protein